MDIKMKRFVHRVRARLREQQIVLSLVNFAGAGMAIAVLISIIALFVPFYYAVWVAAGIVVLSFLGGIAWGIYKTPKPMEAALKVDAKGYHEKISTALFLSGKEDAFSTMQKKDAVKIIETFQIRKEFPVRVSWKRFGVFCVFAMVFVVCSMLDTPAKRLANYRHDVAKEAEEAMERLEKVEKKLEDNKGISENEVAEIKEQLENAKRELNEAQSYDDLKKAEERIAKKMEMASKNVQNKTLGDIMQEAAQSNKEAVEEKQQKLAEEAKEALDKAANGDEDAKEDAYEAMKKLAEMAGDTKLAQAAENYKESEYTSDAYAESVSALEETIENMNETQSAYANNNSTNGKNSASNNSSNNASTSNANLSNNNANQNSGNNSNNASGDAQLASNEQSGNNGTGNGASSQSGSGNGSGNGSGSGSGNGSGGGSGGGGWNRGSKDGTETGKKTAENVTIPDGEIGDDENLTGKQTGNDTSTKQKSNQSQTWSGNKVSYGDVSAEYKEKAYSKINGANYPSKMKNKIRDYFDGLN